MNSCFPIQHGEGQLENILYINFSLLCLCQVSWTALLCLILGRLLRCPPWMVRLHLATRLKVLWGNILYSTLPLFTFSDLGLYIADIVTDLLNGVHWITEDDIIWGGITVISFFMLYVATRHFLRFAEICKNSMCVVYCFHVKY